MNTSLLTRIGALTGAAYVVLAILANDVLGKHPPDSSASAHEIGVWFRAHPATTRTWTMAFLELFALLCFPVFVTVLAWTLRRADHSWLPGIVLGFGWLSAEIKIGSAARTFRFAGPAARDINARIPPSPAWSARMTKTRYLIEMTTISDQKTSERTPRIFAGVGGSAMCPAKHSRNA